MISKELKLNLSHKQIGDDGAMALATELQTNNTLKHLDLSYNQIGDDGAMALAKALCTNATLTHLDLSNNDIKFAGTMTEMLHKNTTLEHLDLSYNQIQNCVGLAGALMANRYKKLKVFKLDGNDVDPYSLENINVALQVPMFKKSKKKRVRKSKSTGKPKRSTRRNKMQISTKKVRKSHKMSR